MRNAIAAVLFSCLFGLAQAAVRPAPAPAPQYSLRKAGSAGPASGPVLAADSPDEAPFMTAAADAKSVQRLPCHASSSGALGGYMPVTGQVEKDGIANDLAPAAWQAFIQNQAITGCSANTVQAVSYNVTRACKQVVAGTNYGFQFDAYYDCTTPQKEPSFGAVKLDAIVYQPLPQQGQNAPPQVNSVWNVTKA